MNAAKNPILIVEDNLDDLFILKRSFKMAGITNALCHVGDGQQAIDYLRGVSPFFDRVAYPIPSLMLLDLKLPAKHGFEVLEWVKQQPDFRRMAVLILTSSANENDVSKAYDLGANAFLVKPTSTEKLTELVQAVDTFWLRQNKFMF